MIEHWSDGERPDASAGPADRAFLERVRAERRARRRPVLATIAGGVALAAAAAIALAIFAPAVGPGPGREPRPGPPDAHDGGGRAIVLTAPLEPAAATLATLTRLNPNPDDLDSLVLSRADCVAWTRAVNPLGP